MVTTAGATTERAIPVNERNRLMGGEYDAAGNLLQFENRSWMPDAFGMHSRIYASGLTNYMYTADDERVRSFTDSALVDTRTVRDFSGRVLTEFTPGPSGVFTARDIVWRNGQAIAQVDAGGAVRHFHLDHLGTPRAISGAVVSQRSYFGFGREATSTAVNDGVSLKFTSHERDQFSGGETTDYLDYMHARSYDPNLGRFLSTDPNMDVEKNLPEPQRWNRYAYVTNNPLKYTDPDGRERLQRYHFNNVPVNREPSSGWRLPMFFGSMLVGGPAVRAGWQMAVGFALGNPNGARQLADAALSPPGSSAMSVEQMGVSIGQRFAGQARGRMAGIAGEVSSLKLSQKEAAAVVDTAVQQLPGMRTGGVVQAGQDLVVASVNPGQYQHVLVIGKNGVVTPGTATLRLVDNELVATDVVRIK